MAAPKNFCFTFHRKDPFGPTESPARRVQFNSGTRYCLKNANRASKSSKDYA
ncbi:hypothetical protein DSO57_1028885 [Entomophthora muscae]|uniref:Uncharacterized protein n=1 Tax=Entomophthora muscae TaxID=34485 RepID=A0ACC2RSA3_9FUNG|nr:hypothetical protein DSO57_1028885 [Entomophthora muscae]